MSKQIVISPRRIAWSSNKYIIVVPKDIGRILHGKLIKVTIEPIEIQEETKNG